MQQQLHTDYSALQNPKPNKCKLYNCLNHCCLILQISAIKIIKKKKKISMPGFQTKIARIYSPVQEAQSVQRMLTG